MEAGRHPLGLSAPSPSGRHPAEVYLATLSRESQRTMRQAIAQVAGLLSNGRLTTDTLDWSAVRFEHATALRSLLAETFAPATANKLLCALRGVLRQAWHLGLMDADACLRAGELPPVRGQTGLNGRPVQAGELQALFLVCADDPTPAGVRDAAILGLLYGVGLRPRDLARLRLADWDSDQHVLNVARKGSQLRVWHLPPGAEDALTAWLDMRGAWAGPMFIPIRKNEVMEPRAMTGQSLLYMLQKRSREAGLLPLSPYDLRRSFISDLLDKGADIRDVQDMAGHAMVKTTARYDRRGVETLKQAANLLQIPYRLAEHN
jgi:site-specific recombinase XerD